jgi:hypothetical protein
MIGRISGRDVCRNIESGAWGRGNLGDTLLSLRASACEEQAQSKSNCPQALRRSPHRNPHFLFATRISSSCSKVWDFLLITPICIRDEYRGCGKLNPAVSPPEAIPHANKDPAHRCSKLQGRLKRVPPASSAHAPKSALTPGAAVDVEPSSKTPGRSGSRPIQDRAETVTRKPTIL